MANRTTLVASLLVAIAVLLSGCAVLDAVQVVGNVANVVNVAKAASSKPYEELELSDSKISIVEIHSNDVSGCFWSDGCRTIVLKIYGGNIEKRILEFYLNPQRHTAELLLFYGFFSSIKLSIEFVTKPGHRYRIYAKPKRVWDEDKSEGFACGTYYIWVVDMTGTEGDVKRGKVVAGDMPPAGGLLGDKSACDTSYPNVALCGVGSMPFQASNAELAGQTRPITFC